MWGSVPEIYWASGRRPATRFLTTNTFLTGNHPGRPPDDGDTGADIDPQTWAYFYEDFTAHPPRYFLDTSPAKVRGARVLPDLGVPARSSTIVDTQYRYVRTIDGIDVYERK